MTILGNKFFCLILTFLALLALKPAFANTFTYEYDALGRLILVDNPVTGETNYEYDEAGNRRSVGAQIAPPPAPSGLVREGPIGMYQQYNSSWNEVAGATGYQIYIGDSWNQTRTGPFSISGGRVTHSGLGRSVWVKACNAAGCSSPAYF